MKRTLLRELAKSKLNDAVLLLANGRFSNAYYLAGYAVELGLKACIAGSFSEEVFPDKNYVNAIYTHELRTLVSLAGLSEELKLMEDTDQVFSANWALVAQWTEASRYETHEPVEAQAMIQALVMPRSGVFEWIQRFW